ncbi:transcriptional regulator, TetR family [Amycolatopsis marina]|uniref:Transcriptional regulator, TetR family n=1 Tax=Amycolatopsis marina TaxID=490629 RepID=A0A1I1C6U3_9PSEU|nr:TetR/AcrR family transcriptional regulator [Amycolatopsis marina]SFB57862.1 transcriptional regulator, TetR family [Amycolatopsis marina]
MPRPRVHDLERLLDTAERLVADAGAEQVTVRALSAAAGVPNGTIYHAFGSIATLLGQVWLRAATAFLDLQAELAERALDGRSANPHTAVAAVVAAADAPAVFAERRPAAARMLLTVKRDTLLGPQLPADLADSLIALDTRLVALLVRLTDLVWGRRDGAAVEVLTTCVVDLPTALFRRALTGPVAEGASPVDAPTRERLAAAVRAVLTVAPPPSLTRRNSPNTKD